MRPWRTRWHRCGRWRAWSHPARVDAEPRTSPLPSVSAGDADDEPFRLPRPLGRGSLIRIRPKTVRPFSATSEISAPSARKAMPRQRAALTGSPPAADTGAAGNAPCSVEGVADRDGGAPTAVLVPGILPEQRLPVLRPGPRRAEGMHEVGMGLHAARGGAEADQGGVAEHCLDPGRSFLNRASQLHPFTTAICRVMAESVTLMALTAI